MHPIEVLERYWNYTSFRPLQEEIINSVLEQNDTFALLPTGGGKSICYQIPALIQEGICLVISPLIALMKDQVQQLKKKGIKATAITSGMSHKDLDTALDNCIYGNFKFLYLSPERLQQRLVQERIKQMPVNLIAVDEAHCISQWGHDFRPAYRNIITLRQLHPHVTCIAVTASAKPMVISEIADNLDFLNQNTFKASFKRTNISYQIINTQDKAYELVRLLSSYKDTAIVYVRSRKKSVELSQLLNIKQISATYFHGGMSTSEKETHFQQWLHNRVNVMVATTAFGMGIDKPDVRSVIHYNLPESLENYYQESGRAGRDGNPAKAIVLKKPIDEEKLKAQFLGSLPDVKTIIYTYRKLCNYFQISYGEGEQSQHQLHFKDFCKTYKLKPGSTYNVLQILDRHSIISFNQEFNYKTKIQFLIQNDALFSYIAEHKSQNAILKALLRTYGGIFDFPTKVNLNLISKKADCTDQQLIAVLKDLEKQGIISLDMANSDSEITFISPREDDKTIHPIAPLIKQQQQLKHEQINAVISFVNSTSCLRNQLLAYFEEFETDTCGICSHCLAKKNKTNSNDSIAASILFILKKKDHSSRELQQILGCDTAILLKHLENLITLNKIGITNRNTYTLHDC